MYLERRKKLGVHKGRPSWHYLLIGIILAIGSIYALMELTASPPKIGIITIDEPIYDFKYVEQLEDALHDPSIEAVVLKVNSPGGSVEPCFQTESSVSRLASKKPVIADLEGLGASGAYLVASAADYIYIHDWTLIGSFGVVAIWVSYEDYFENRGIKYHIWKTGEMKDWFAIYRDPTEEENRKIQEIVEHWRNMLFDHIYRNRSLQENRIENLRDGSTIHGVEALEYGLADELGSYRDAVKEAAKKAGLKEYEEFHLS